MSNTDKQDGGPLGRNIVGAIEKYAVSSYKLVLIHFFVAIALLLLIRFIGNFDGFDLNIKQAYFVTITSSLSASAAALLAVSLALATFFSRYVTDWRDKLIAELRQNQSALETQMAKSAVHHGEISSRLTELYIQSTSYIPGQPIDVEKVDEASQIFQSWANMRSSESAKAGKAFNYGDLSTYESFEKHLFDANLRCHLVRQNLIFLHAAETASRSVLVFPPQLIAWTTVLLLSLVFAVLGSVDAVSGPFYLPIIVLLVYLMLVTLVSLLIASVNIVIFAGRVLETGYGKAMEQLANKAGDMA
jgi:hypothetical protein